MPRKRRYVTDALRQRAYRQRKQSAPLLPARTPASRTWNALILQAEKRLRLAQEQMQSYFDERTERWQESERGEAFTERIDGLEEVLTALKQVMP